MGFPGRRTASTCCSAIGTPPPSRRPSTGTTLEDGQRRQLTSPAANVSDGWPNVSPDGRYLGFVRMNHSDFGGSVFVLRFGRLQAGGAPVQLTFGHLVTTFDWTADSRSIIHDSRRGNGLWRVGVAGGTSDPCCRTFAHSPSVARSGTGVVYQHGRQSTPTSGNCRYRGRQPGTVRGRRHFAIIASTYIDKDPQYSPDGRGSLSPLSRSGHGQLWVANRDGSGSRPLTKFAGGWLGSPSWSADGQRIAFDAIQGRDVESLHRPRQRRPRSYARFRRIQQYPPELVS